jgi:hypothetical protein
LFFKEMNMMRSFSLNDPEAYEALRSPPDPWGWGPRLSRNSLWGERTDPVAVMAGNEVEAGDALKEWLGHVARSTESSDAGRVASPEQREEMRKVGWPAVERPKPR